MCLTALMAASLAVTAASTVAQMSAANQAAKQSYAAEQRNLQQTYAENYRQQVETNQIARQQESDRLRQSRLELGTINATAAELGASESSLQALLGEAAYVTGVDLSRIEYNRQQDVQRIQAGSRAGQVRYANATSLAHTQASSAKTSALLNGIGSGLQIGMNYAGMKADLAARTNTKR